MTQDARVTICVPAYNAESTIKESLESILSQTYENMDVIVVDDCSTDGTHEIIQSFRDTRLRVIRHKKNKGPGPNWDYCIHVGRGEYMSLFHADDVYEPQIVEHQVSFLDRYSDAGFVLTLGYHNDGNSIRFVPEEFADAGGWNRTYDFATIFKAVLKYYNFMLTPSAMVRTDIYQNYVKTYNHGRFGVSGDLWMFLHILEKYRMGILPEPLMTWRNSPGQWSSIDKYLRTSHHPFFDVIYYYMSKSWVTSQLNDEDYRNLFLLEMVDSYTQLINCIIMGRREQARAMAKGAWRYELLHKVIANAPPWRPSRYYRWWLVGILANTITRIPESFWPKELLFQRMYGRFQ